MSRSYVADPERVEGALLGAAVGDALGWPQEDRSAIVGGRAARQVPPAMQFRDWERNPGGQFRPYRQPVPAGTYSDDTQLLLAVTRACLRGDDWHRWLREVELPFWPAYERGGGGAVLRSARAWAEGRPPWAVTSARTQSQARLYFDAGANGVAMRIAPHAVVTAAHRGAEPLLERCLADGLLTHGHPRALVGALVYAVGLRAALNGSTTVGYGHFVEAALDEPLWRDPRWIAQVAPPDWQHARRQATGEDVSTAWSAAGREMEALLRIGLDALGSGSMANDERTLDAMGCFGKQGGSGTITAAAALYVSARAAARPPSGLLRTAFLPSADTDTLASMTGAVLGAVHGSLWLGGLDRAVQDADYIGRMARQLAVAPATADATVSPLPDRPVTAGAVKRFLDRLDRPGPTTLPDGREAVVAEARRLEGTGRIRVVQFLVAAGDGQTLAFDIVSKRPPTEPDSTPPSEPDPASADPIRGESPAPQEPEGAGSRGGSGLAVGLVETRLAAADADRSAHFYLRVLGLPGRRDGAAVRVAGGLVLREGPPPAGPGGGAVYVLASDDLDAAAARLRNSKYRDLLLTAEPGALHVQDPDGYRLRLVPG